MSNINSTKIASNAAGIAPLKMRSELFNASPVTMNSPNPPAPINAANVAVPILITAAVLIPAKMVGIAMGISTYLNLCHVFNPIPFATFFKSGSTENNPIVVFLNIGSKAYKNKAIIAGTTPIPKSGIINARSAIEGTVCSSPTKYNTGFEIEEKI